MSNGERISIYLVTGAAFHTGGASAILGWPMAWLTGLAFSVLLTWVTLEGIEAAAPSQKDRNQ